MKLLLFLLITISLISCKKEPNYSVVIWDNVEMNSEFLQKTDIPEKALISGFLLAYANECSSEKETIKCNILKQLNIENECNEQHISFLKKWFSEDIMIKIKLLNCPNLPLNGAIQNNIKKIELKRNSDHITISIHVKGLNNSQEKSWDIEQTNSYIIKNNKFIPIPNGNKN